MGTWADSLVKSDGIRRRCESPGWNIFYNHNIFDVDTVGKIQRRKLGCSQTRLGSISTSHPSKVGHTWDEIRPDDRALNDAGSEGDQLVARLDWYDLSLG